ncbi:hypothetical protein [Gemmobacter caeruleus]|uniref:hypothetical protein n=1 Tax=Gemmobacter caeruleus TaxID=2595004 RepID=UPI0013969B21|nr:hypothetical protein [Gemmobacter caeruleus]
MNLFRVIILAGSTVTLLAAGYLAYAGVWGEDTDVRAGIASIRAGSAGNSIGNASVK